MKLLIFLSHLSSRSREWIKSLSRSIPRNYASKISTANILHSIKTVCRILKSVYATIIAFKILFIICLVASCASLTSFFNLLVFIFVTTQQRQLFFINIYYYFKWYFGWIKNNNNKRQRLPILRRCIAHASHSTRTDWL